MSAPPAAIEVNGLTKHFGATVALEGVSLSVPPGDVHALLGENGAGKSTLVKILSGLLNPDSGDILLFGEATRLSDPRKSHSSGIQTAFQEISLVKDLTVTQNMLVPYEPSRWFGQVRRRQSEERVKDLFDRLALDDADPRAEVGTLDLSVRQKIAIARAVARDPKILLLDEPTSSLSAKDVDWLGGLIDKLRQQGVTIVFISHRMQEVRRLCDHLTVLRNGANVGSFAVDDISEEEVIALVIGRSLAATYPPKPPRAERLSSEPELAAR
jgi:ribose transport system ATP-binding protein